MSKFRTSLEICTDDAEAWTAFLSICAEAFQNNAAFIRCHPNPDQRKRFLPRYLKYIYETELSDGRAGLACVKLMDGSKAPKIVYGLCGIFPNSQKTKGDSSAAREICPAGFKRCIEEDQWVEKNANDKIQKILNSLGIPYLNCTYHACAKEYMNSGLGSRYMIRASKMVLQDGIRRGLIPCDKPVVAYGILDDVRPRRFQAENGVTEIAHLHYRTPPSYDIKCVENGDKSGNQDFNCVFIVCKEIGGRKFLLENISKAFSLRCSL